MPRELTLGALFCRISGKAAAKVNSRGRPINPWEAPVFSRGSPVFPQGRYVGYRGVLPAIEKGLSVTFWKVKGSRRSMSLRGAHPPQISACPFFEVPAVGIKLYDKTRSVLGDQSELPVSLKRWPWRRVAVPLTIVLSEVVAMVYLAIPMKGGVSAVASFMPWSRAISARRFW